MIGTKVKGFRHLIRMAKTSGEAHFFFKNDVFSVYQGIALYVSAEEKRNPYMMSKSDYLLIFNNRTSNVGFNMDYHIGSKIEKRIKEVTLSLPHLWVVPVERKNFKDESIAFSDIVCVPTDFDKSYDDFCAANKKQMPNATRFADKNCSAFKYLFAITSGSKNFFFWAVNAMFKQGVSIFFIEKVLNWNDKYSQLAKNLKKGTITGYTNIHELFALIRELTVLRRDKRANDVINMFNTAQKKSLKEVSLKDRDYETLSKFGKLSSKKKNNFIRKMSTIEDPNEILKQMSFLADVHFEWKKESLLEFIKNTENFNCEIVIDRDNIVLLKVKDYETVKRLAKTTNWCISKDKKYWNQYVEDNSMATQYVLFDFSRKEDDNLSIVGFTSVHDRGITNAHDFQNKNLMGERRINTVSEIKSFVSKFIDSRNIYGVLDKYGIKLSDVVSYEPNQFSWSRENMFDYLNQCVNEDDYYIIADYGDKVALIVEDDNVRYFLGDAYIEQRAGRGVIGGQHILFADFTKKQNDPEKLVFGIITHNFEEHESHCNRLYNDRFEPVGQSFDSKLEEYGLPYDIICRKNDVIERFYNSFAASELATLKDLIRDNKVVESLKKMERSNFIKDYIINVTCGQYSMDYINLFYDNGLTLCEVIGPKHTGELIKRIVSTLFDAGRNIRGGEVCVPNENAINDFKNGLTDNYNSALYIGNFLMLMNIIDKENAVKDDMFYRTVMYIYERHYPCDLFDLIATRIFNKVSNQGKCYETAKFIVAYAYNNGRPRVVNAINSINKNKELENYKSRCNPFNVTTTEMWVSRENDVYVVERMEEMAAKASKR